MRKWTIEEKEKLSALYCEKTYNVHDIAKILNRSYNAVKTQALRLGLRRPENYHVVRWTYEMDEVLRREYATTPTNEIAKKLNMTLYSVYHRARNIGLNKKITRHSMLGEWFSPEIEKVKSDVVAYIAGILDGEGSILIGRNPKRNLYTPVMQFVNTNEGLLDYIAQKIGGAKYYEYKRKKKRARDKKDCYYLKIRQTNKVKTLCETFLPYLIVKKKQAKLMLKFCDAKLEGNLNLQKQLYQIMRKLNR